MHGHVTLISCSPEAAAIIASGGRISTMDGTADEIYAKSLAAGQPVMTMYQQNFHAAASSCRQ